MFPIFCVLFLFPLVSRAQAFVDPEIEPAFDRSTRVTVIGVMVNSSDGLVPPRRYHRAEIVAFLKSRTSLSRQALLSRLAQLSPADFRIRQFYWINNTFSARVTPAGLNALRNAPEVRAVLANPPIDFLRPIDVKPARLFQYGVYPYDLSDIKVDALAASHPGIDGTGVTVGTIDTGVEGSHPALAGKVTTFFDAMQRKTREPHDYSFHGTHTSGTILGGNRTDLIMGVAPGAHLIASTGIDPDASLEDLIAAMQFMLEQAPRVVNNSWRYRSDSKYMEPVYQAISAWEAAGTLAVFAAGNEGPKARSVGYPSNHPAAITIGATGPGGKLAKFSSRGPVLYHGEVQNKPEITAPGVDIRSSVPDNRFSEMSGTSMAAPHVTGAIALVLQANPGLTPRQIKALLIASANPMDEKGNPGTAGVWNPLYGNGLLNVEHAVALAIDLLSRRSSSSGLAIPLTSPEDVTLESLALVSEDAPEFFR